VQQDNRQLAWHCYDLLSQLIDGQAPEPLQRWQVTIGLGVVLASVLLTLRQASRARRKR
jgi:hypothetical protein